jgi:restriction endonuclease S subunit
LSIDKKNESHILKDGDILFVGKGMRNFAWTYRKEYGLAIASSIFYVIRVYETSILPDYLTVLFNSSFYQNIFQQLGAGSSIPSIRKSELEVLLINVPSLEVQNNIVELNSMYLYDLDISNRIMEEKKKLFTSVLNKLITK